MANAIIKNDKKTIKGWAFFDWANSAYSLVISTAIFPPFFDAVAPDKISLFGSSIESSAMYSWSVSLAFLIVAFISPMLSGIADYSGRRMIFLKLFTIIGSLACASLFFFKDSGTVLFGLFAFIIGTVGFGASLVFYNAYLPEIATEDQFDKVSAKGFAYGYCGSVILLIIILVMITFYAPLGFENESLPTRIGFLLVGVWWYGFALYSFKTLPKDSRTKIEFSFIKKGFHEVKNVFVEVLKSKNIRRFLLSYFFFIGGVNTVIYLATIFAKSELQFETQDLIIVVLVIQLVAAMGAYLFAKISDMIGNKKALLLQLVIWIAVCIAAFYTSGKISFYLVSAFVGLVMGGIQSLSRSSYSKMIKNNVGELTSYFSFYDVLTKVAVVSGTFIFGLVDQVTGNIRYSVLSIAIFFVIALVILIFTKMESDNANVDLAR